MITPTTMSNKKQLSIALRAAALCSLCYLAAASHGQTEEELSQWVTTELGMCINLFNIDEDNTLFNDLQKAFKNEGKKKLTAIEFIEIGQRVQQRNPQVWAEEREKLKKAGWKKNKDALLDAAIQVYKKQAKIKAELKKELAEKRRKKTVVDKVPEAYDGKKFKTGDTVTYCKSRKIGENAGIREVGTINEIRAIADKRTQKTEYIYRIARSDGTTGGMRKAEDLEIVCPSSESTDKLTPQERADQQYLADYWKNRPVYQPVGNYAGKYIEDSIPQFEEGIWHATCTYKAPKPNTPEEPNASAGTKCTVRNCRNNINCSYCKLCERLVAYDNFDNFCPFFCRGAPVDDVYHEWKQSYGGDWNALPRGGRRLASSPSRRGSSHTTLILMSVLFGVFMWYARQLEM